MHSITSFNHRILFAASFFSVCSLILLNFIWGGNIRISLPNNGFSPLNLLLEAPNIDSASPANILVHSPAFTLTVYGTNFTNNSVIFFDKQPFTTNYLSANALSAEIPSDQLLIARTITVFVRNNDTLEDSNYIDFEIRNPIPALSSVQPNSSIIGEDLSILTVSGSNFESTSIVRWDGKDCSTTYIDASSLSFEVSESMLSSTGEFTITVFNPLPGGGVSNQVIFTIKNPIPVIASITPTSIMAGSASLDIQINGEGFIDSSILSFGDQIVTSSYESNNLITAHIPASLLEIGNVVSISVENPAPGGGKGNQVEFTVVNPMPVLSDISPKNIKFGSPNTEVTLTGSGFVKTSKVFWDQNELVTSFVDSTTLTTMIPAEFLVSIGQADVSVQNPAPGGGISSKKSFEIKYYDDPLFSNQAALGSLDPEVIWKQSDGDPSVIIAVIDSGIDLEHEDLQPNLWLNPGEVAGNGIDDDNNGFIDDINGWNFYDDSANVLDMNGHGTLVAGIVAAKSDNAKGIAGVCGNCRVMVLKISNNAGGYNYSDMANAINYATEKGARVINLSIGSISRSQSVEAAIANAIAHNIVIIGAAGNSANEIPVYPAAYEDVLAVASIDLEDHLLSFSNFGVWVDIMAPGEDVLTTALGGDYLTNSGTSLSSAFVSGAAGLLVSMHPEWTRERIISQLINTAVPIDVMNPGYSLKLGHGKLSLGNLILPAYPIISLEKTTVIGSIGNRLQIGQANNVKITLCNEWAEAGNVTATLSSEDSAITISVAQVDFSTLNSGKCVQSENAFQVQVNPSAAFNHEVNFHLRIYVDGILNTETSFSLLTASNELEVMGTITTSKIWSAQNTYVITGNIGVAPGATLTIQPGTVIKFKGDYYFNVGGTLVANGSQDQPIQFLPYTPGSQWGYIKFDDLSTDAVADAQENYLSGNSLQYVSISGSRQGVQCNYATPYLNHLIVQKPAGINCTTGSTTLYLLNSDIGTNLSVYWGGISPVSVVSRSSTIRHTIYSNHETVLSDMIVWGRVVASAATIRDSRLYGADGGGSMENDVVVGNIKGRWDIQNSKISHGSVDGGVVTNSEFFEANLDADSAIGNKFIRSYLTSTIAEENWIEDSPQWGIQGKGTATIRNNTVINAFAEGISISSGVVEGNTITYTTGDGLVAGSASIRNNVFIGTRGRTIYLTGIPVELSGNNFERNLGLYDIYVAANAGSGTIQAQNNWWGTTNVDLIQPRIFDYYMDWTLPIVNYSPILPSYSSSTPTYARSLLMDPASPIGIETGQFTIEYSSPMDTSTLPSAYLGFDQSFADHIFYNVFNFGAWYSTSGSLIFLNGKVYGVVPNWQPSFGSCNSNGGKGGAGAYEPENIRWRDASGLPAGLSTSDVLFAAKDNFGTYYFLGCIEGLSKLNPNNSLIKLGNLDRKMTYIGVDTDNNIYVACMDDQYSGCGGSFYYLYNFAQSRFELQQALDPISGAWVLAPGVQQNTDANHNWYRIQPPGSFVVHSQDYRYPVANVSWIDSTHLRVTYEFTAVNPRRQYWLTVQNAVDAEGRIVAPVTDYSFTLDYADALADDTAPAAPVVTATRTGTLSSITAAWFASDPESEITGYRYAIGSIPGGSDVVNWTNISGTTLTRSGLNLLQGHTYFVSVIARNQGGIWSLPGVSNGVLAGPNPIPNLTSLSTNEIFAGSSQFTLDLIGSAFMLESKVIWEGQTLSSTYLESNRLQVLIPSTLINVAGIRHISVQNPGPGGGTSSQLIFTIKNPLPSINSIDPQRVLVNTGNLTLHIVGDNFVFDSIVLCDGEPIAASQISKTNLQAVIPAAKLLSAGSLSIKVRNNEPGGGYSAPLALNVDNPLPVLTKLTPSLIAKGSPTITITLQGKNFVPSSTVYFNGISQTTVYVSDTTLRVAASSLWFVNSDPILVKVVTPGPGGGESGTQKLLIADNYIFIPIILR